MNLCIFAGTFNPIHNAHLAMAEYALGDFDKILFIPAYKPPHKDYQDNMSVHRLNMVRLATEYNPKFEVSDIEFQRETISYTYLTILELYKKYNIDSKISFIIGSDAFKGIENWYEIDKLKKIIDFIVFIRENETVNFDYLEGYNFKIARMKFIDISSTELRNRIKNGIPVNDLIPKEVEEYIIKNGLYKD